MSLRVKVYISDEGFGHLVRQEAVIRALMRSIPDVEVTIQTREKVDAARQKFGSTVRYIPRFNNLMTRKTSSGCLDREGTERVFDAYPELAHAAIERECAEFAYDFVISDMVPEAFAVARRMGVPAFGVFHFDWAWFCSQVFPHKTGLIALIDRFCTMADRLYVPPFTPPAIVQRFDGLIAEVPFIINTFDPIDIPDRGKSTVLIMDNGTATLSEIIIENLPVFESLQEFHFFIPSALAKASTNNITTISDLKKIHSHIPRVDAVVARAGYNTITECLISRTPMLLVEENGNPEVAFNLRAAFELGCAARISPDDYRRAFPRHLREFMRDAYESIRGNMAAQSYASNGAQVVVDDILTQVLQPSREVLARVG